MNLTSNIDLFRYYTGATFARLYEHFPIALDMNSSQLVDELKLVSDAQERKRHVELVEAAWQWLVATGYLQHDEQTGAYSLTPLSFDGLTFLDDPDSGVCRGDKLRTLTQRVTTATVSETVAEIVARLLGSGAKAAYGFIV